MPADAITFATEDERVKAREQYVAIRAAIHELEGGELNVTKATRDFDAAFPPIAPPKMVPCEGRAIVNGKGKCMLVDFTGEDLRMEPGERFARVRVEEVDDE